MSALTVSPTLYPSQRIHATAFFAALVLAPLCVTGATFWLVVPVFALLMGTPAYLILGTPLLLWHLSRKPCVAGEVAFLAFAANLAAMAATLLTALFLQDKGLHEFALLYFGFGLIFAPLWGWMFGTLYTHFTRNAA